MLPLFLEKDENQELEDYKEKNLTGNSQTKKYTNFFLPMLQISILFKASDSFHHICPFLFYSFLHFKEEMLNTYL